MPQDFIHPGTSGYAGQELIAASKMLRAARDQLNKVFAIVNHNRSTTDSTDAGFHDAAVALGITDAQAHAVFDHLNGALGALNGTMMNSDAITFIDLVG